MAGGSVCGCGTQAVHAGESIEAWRNARRRSGEVSSGN